MSDPRAEGAPPLVFRALDLRDRPDHPEHRFDVTVERGTTVAAVGDEDSGVGDLGSFALGLRRPISGRAEVLGTLIADLPYYDLLVFRRRLGYLPLGDGLLQNLTLRDNVALPLRYASDHRLSEVDGRVAQLVDELHLRAAAGLRPAQANEEDRRRAAVARAIALDPELVVLEAPFDGLTGRAAVDLLEHAGRRGDGTRRTVFLTAQELVPSVQRLLSRVVRVVDGEAVDDEPNPADRP
ncbi:MAG: ATP-binding cassette domain-containing protein [Gemmatimonadetes bacterium]|nr:ATP-binding cassette domain-containing protein [Gemmatimonadota bacterium]